MATRQVPPALPPETRRPGRARSAPARTQGRAAAARRRPPSVPRPLAWPAAVSPSRPLRPVSPWRQRVAVGAVRVASAAAFACAAIASSVARACAAPAACAASVALAAAAPCAATVAWATAVAWACACAAVAVAWAMDAAVAAASAVAVAPVAAVTVALIWIWASCCICENHQKIASVMTAAINASMYQGILGGRPSPVLGWRRHVDDGRIARAGLDARDRLGWGRSGRLG